jgi:hypothetical protein
VIFAENKQLFGFDTTEGIVAVEFFPPNQVHISTREADGRTSLRSEEFSPFLWNSSEGTPLEGTLALGKLITFPDWRSHQKPDRASQKGEHPSLHPTIRSNNI